jgi:hypothetical protein
MFGVAVDGNATLLSKIGGYWARADNSRRHVKIEGSSDLDS